MVCWGPTKFRVCLRLLLAGKDSDEANDTAFVQSISRAAGQDNRSHLATLPTALQQKCVPLFPAFPLTASSSSEIASSLTATHSSFICLSQTRVAISIRPSMSTLLSTGIDYAHRYCREFGTI
jgi:hypothetical protein